MKLIATQMNNARTHSAVQAAVPLPAWGGSTSDRLGYDGVGRMITKRYLTGGINSVTNAYNNSASLVGHTTSFDRAGNKLYERHLEAESRSHLYQPFNADGSFGIGYDSTNRLLQYQRGALSSAVIPFRVHPGASIDTPITLPGTDQVRTYGLDGLGNWKTTNSTLVGSGGSTTSTAEVRQHNYVNEITSKKDTTGGTPTTTPFAYDKNGNLLNDGVRIYTYDVLNRLVRINDAANPSHVLAAYVYDPFNRRVQKTVSNGGLTGDLPNGTTDYLYDGDQIIEERDNSAPTVWTKVNFWGQYVDELMFLAVSTATTYRVLSDLLYRSVATVTTDNVIVEAYDTDAYGNTLCYSGPGTDGVWFTDDDVPTNNPMNYTIFTGRQFDPESLIYNYRARYFSPAIGRFINRDPLKNAERRQGPNLYWYVQNNAVNRVDPMGLDTCCPCCNVQQQAVTAAQAQVQAAQGNLQRDQNTYNNDVAKVNADAVKGKSDRDLLTDAEIALVAATDAVVAACFTGNAPACAAATRVYQAAIAAVAAAWLLVNNDIAQYNTDQAKIPGDLSQISSDQQSLQTAQKSLTQAQANLQACQTNNANTLPGCPCQ